MTTTVNKLRSQARDDDTPYNPAKDLAETIRQAMIQVAKVIFSLTYEQGMKIDEINPSFFLLKKSVMEFRTMSFSPASPPVMPSQLDLATESQMKFPSHLILLISTVSDRLASKRLKAKHGVSTLGELAKRSKGTLISPLGKSTGETLYNAVHGIDVKSYIKRVFFLILLEVVQYIYIIISSTGYIDTFREQ